MIPAKQRFNIYPNDIKRFFEDFRGGYNSNQGCFYKDLCTINTHRDREYYEISKFKPEGQCVTKRYRIPETIIDFINNLKDSEVEFKLKKQF